MDNQQVRQATDRILQDPVVRRLRSALAEASSPSLFLVGGALRDGWLGRETRDFDFVVPGEARAVAKSVAAALDARCVLLDEDWGVARLIWSPAGKSQDSVRLDFASMRGEGIQEDLWQRDFTCNAMAMRIGPHGDDTVSGWEDPTGGMRDLRARLIRMVHPARLREDPLRLVRAFRLACTLDFQIERLTFDAIHAARDGILSVAAERTRDELFKILACPDSLAWVLQMDETGLLTTIFPELQGLKGLKQGKFHHLDAWNHTLEAYRILEEGWRAGLARMAPWDPELREWLGKPEDVLPLLKAAVLFHDVGKPGTYTVDAQGEPHFYGHAPRGADIVANAMRRLRTSRDEEERTKKWVRYHMGPVHMMRAMEADHLTERAKIRFLRRLGDDVPGMLLVSLADFLATGGPSATGDRQKAFFGLLDSLLELYFRRDAASIGGKNLVTGEDLMDFLGIPPGPEVGRLLRLLEEARVEGTVKNREEALRLAGSMVAGTPSQYHPPKDRGGTDP
ncbi:MAG: CCA tRNA nucleotidyltransferase [Thermodesulfobacteriota bacterium]